SAINDGCMPPCVVFGAPTIVRNGSAILAVLGGTQATAETVQSDESGNISITALDVANRALCADERKTADRPIRFASATFSPDGALWLGTQEQILIRVSPELSEAKRICLPKDARGTEMTALHAHPQGRLYLGMTPGLLGFADWRQ